MISEKSMQAVLKTMPATELQAQEQTKLSRYSVVKAIRALRQSKQCHVGAWRQIGKKPSRVFYPGPGKDVEPPEPKRQEVRIERIGNFPRRDPLVAALFGQP